MKKSYINPTSLQFNMQAEQMIAASLNINEGSADQWSNGSDGWESVNWESAEDIEVEE